MQLDYLHNHPEFHDLLRTVEHQKNIDRALVEKDYWIMHCLYGLQKAGFECQTGAAERLRGEEKEDLLRRARESANTLAGKGR